MSHQVRTHTRRTASGKTVTVHQHQRRGGSVSPGHAREMAHKAYRYGARHKKGRAALFGLLAAGEITLWLTVGGTALLLAAVAGTLGFLASSLGAFSGTQERKRREPGLDYGFADEEPAPKPVKVNRARRVPAASETHAWPESPKWADDEPEGRAKLACGNCNGTGKNLGATCSRCDGSGIDPYAHL